MTDERPSFWTQVKLKPELVPFITLSSRDIQELTQQAVRNPDPGAWLSEELNRRGLAKKLIREVHDEARMVENADRIRAVHRWPGKSLAMKSQPWIEEKRFGVIEADDPLTVIGYGLILHTYDTIEELVKVWSVE